MVAPRRRPRRPPTRCATSRGGPAVSAVRRPRSAAAGPSAPPAVRASRHPRPTKSCSRAMKSRARSLCCRARRPGAKMTELALATAVAAVAASTCSSTLASRATTGEDPARSAASEASGPVLDGVAPADRRCLLAEHQHGAARTAACNTRSGHRSWSVVYGRNGVQTPSLGNWVIAKGGGGPLMAPEGVIVAVRSSRRRRLRRSPSPRSVHRSRSRSARGSCCTAAARLGLRSAGGSTSV